ncbi:MAG TPA: hypothetical protein V6D22_14115 [Candidatus Obscuribacterales bacterium]
MNKPLNPWKLTGYKAGQNVVCKVIRPEPGGYAVHIPKDNLPGFLPTDAKLKDGEEVLASFVCVHNNRVLLSPKMHSQLGVGDTSGRYKAQSGSGVNWQAQLQNGGEQQPAAAAQPQDEAEAAFAVWANDRPVDFKLRRAIDLILPSIGEDTKNTSIRIGDEDLEWLITDMEGGMRTGCMKAFCEPRKSRSAVLLYKGRAVGCIYGNKSLPEPQPTEPSLQMMFKDLTDPETHIMLYDLPEEVTLAMSALFLGYPVERSDDLDARSYIEYIGSWLTQREQTACLAVNFNPVGTCLAFVHKGRYVGAFYVEEQKFAPDLKFLYDLIAQDPRANVHASILPPEMTSASVRFGFSLSMAKKNASNSVYG